MLRFNAQFFVRLIRLLDNARSQILDTKDAVFLDSSKRREAILEFCDLMKENLKKLGLTVSLAQLERIADEVTRHSKTRCTNEQLDRRLDELGDRITDEMEDTVVMSIPKQKADYYTKPLELFSQESLNKFPSTTSDVEEAGKSYASGRNTACVFHLSRVMERGLRVIGGSLGIPDPNPTWDHILKKCDSELAKRIQDRLPLWKSNDDFFSEATANLRAVKSAWRNPTMHVGSQYSDEVAEDIFRAVRGFMRHLAVKLSEPLSPDNTPQP
jgi:hypothetical protein